MSSLSSESPTRSPRPVGEWHGHYDVAERRRGSGGSGSGLLIFGLAAVALGAAAWYYLGPDVRRYLKMRSM